MHQRIKIKDIAKYCMVSRTTVRRWIDDGKLQALRLPSGHSRIRQVDYRHFLENCEIPLKEASFQSNPQKDVNTDIFDEGSSLVIVTELPGINEKDIKVEVKGDRLEFYARTQGRRYFKNIGLPCRVKEKPGLTYKNGILRISLEKETI
jgi:excisionase family DNA binding protein